MVKKILFILLLFIAQVSKSQISVNLSFLNFKETNDKYLMVRIENKDTISYFIRDFQFFSRFIYLHDIAKKDTINASDNFAFNSITLCDLDNYDSSRMNEKKNIELYEPNESLLNNMKSALFEYMDKNKQVFENINKEEFIMNYVWGVLERFVFFNPGDYYFYMLNLCLLEEEGGSYEFIFDYTGEKRASEYLDTIKGFDFELPDKIGEYYEFNKPLRESISVQFK